MRLLFLKYVYIFFRWLVLFVRSLVSSVRACVCIVVGSKRSNKNKIEKKARNTLQKEMS